MKAPPARYPVDRYLVESSKKFEMVNIIDDDLWNSEPALKPEDEIILKKLHEMLQSTADDLKLLSGELTKFREPGVQIQMTPTPLDEEFNEKVHIEEVVNAKFYGYKMFDNEKKQNHQKLRKSTTEEIKPTINAHLPKISNHSVKTNTAQKPMNKNLGISHTKVIQINGNQNSTKTEILNNGTVVSAPAVAYNEFSYKYEEPKNKTPRKVFEVQEMPSINIRGELKEQKVLQLDIIPDNKEIENPSDMTTRNVAVVTMQHNMSPRPKKTASPEQYIPAHHIARNKPSVRKVSKLSTGESCGSSNNNSSDTQVRQTQKRIITNIRTPKTSARSVRKKEPEKRSHLHLDEWKRKLNSVYSTSNIKKNKCNTKAKVSPKKKISQNTLKPNPLNNSEYIPYSKLTVGGVRVSDIEKEISHIANKNEIPLSPILDKILSSRENSFSKNSPQKQKTKDSLKILTTSDENLLQEVIDIEKTISETLSKELKKTNIPNLDDIPNESEGDDSYADDFEDDKSNQSEKSINNKDNDTHSGNSNRHDSYDDDLEQEKSNDNINILLPSTSNTNIINRTYKKTSNLSFKNTVDVFEFVHSVDTQDSGTQSNTRQIISPKETQTSPRNSSNIQPIHNDLWPSTDPMVEVEKMFKIEKEFIRKLIVEEYGDILEKNVSKPSTSKDDGNMKNVAASQKNTQTSPAHTKHVMTSPTKTKTRTTSPFAVLSVDHHTSPLVFVTNEDNIRVSIQEDDDLGISINLSSPRFSLRLPQNSREVLSNLGDSPQKPDRAKYASIKSTLTSTSSIDADSSEISSLGEIKLKLRRKLRGNRVMSSSESTCSSSTIHSSDLESGILPLKSEGETSLLCNQKHNIHSKSEGETSFGRF